MSLGVLALISAYILGVIQMDADSAPATWVRRAATSFGVVRHKPGSQKPELHDEEAEHEHDHADDDHAHEGHEHGHAEATSLELSAEALANLGLTQDQIRPVEETTFIRTVTVPAIVVVCPGRTQLPVSTPMTGIVTHVHAVTGEAVAPGSLLFQLRLTHEDLVTAQKDFLQSIGELQVEEKEISRLAAASESGAIPGRVLLERQYARDKILASLASQREALRLHGLSASQIERIEKERRLLTELAIRVPTEDGHEHDEGDELQLSGRGIIRQTAFEVTEPLKSVAPVPSEPTLVIQKLNVHKGDSVATGDVLCVLADYGQLYIEGQAFESDAAAIAEAKLTGRKASAIVEQDGKEIVVPNLEITFLANEVDPAARTLGFYVSLDNQMIEDVKNSRGQRFVTWRFRPGQRMQLRVPVEEWKDQLVFPADAVVREGPESYVFQQNGDHFDRVPVHETFRDRSTVVVANDGAIFPGDVVALRGANQMQLALKNKAGGGVDPHAGHNH
jgi:multidrug efflux pump subunit AcrA (membrane-fusion protein)